MTRFIPCRTAYEALTKACWMMALSRDTGRPVRGRRDIQRGGNWAAIVVR